MFYKFIAEVGFVEYYIFFSVITGFICANYKKNIHNWLLILLFTFFISEIALIYANAFLVAVGWIYAPSTTIHNTVWLLILGKTFNKGTKFLYIVWAYFVLCILDTLFWEGYTDFNTFSFLLGAALYISMFIKEYITKLNNEDFAFFQKNESLLLFSPILFFMGVSIMFTFNDTTLSETKIIGDTSLYEIAVNFPNLISYSIINIYFFKEKQFKK
ncbi:hypothetical protein ACLI1A_06910 [Flavobacterium sp. RHBU_3]|uniref:hypothetical protein n=1 Tax=Flavobacterium sp. RHBU_3 TaxID=3391184 RepID=UPI003984FBB0